MLASWRLTNEFKKRTILIENQQSVSTNVDLQDALLVANIIDKEILIDTPNYFDQNESWTLNILLPNENHSANLTIGLVQKTPWPIGKSCLINFIINDKIRGTTELNSQVSQFCNFIITNQQNTLNINKYEYTPVTVTND